MGFVGGLHRSEWRSVSNNGGGGAPCCTSHHVGGIRNSTVAPAGSSDSLIVATGRHLYPVVAFRQSAKRIQKVPIPISLPVRLWPRIKRKLGQSISKETGRADMRVS